MEAAPAGESAGIEAAVVGAARVAEDDGSGARMEAAPVGAVRAAEAGGSKRATTNNNEAAVSAADDGRRRQRRQRMTTPPPSYPYAASGRPRRSPPSLAPLPPRLPSHWRRRFLHAAAPHPFFSLFGVQEGTAARRQKSALDAGGDKWEAAATLAVVPPCHRILFPGFSLSTAASGSRGDGNRRGRSWWRKSTLGKGVVPTICQSVWLAKFD
uniref:Uncharacterized protein n=1 Tax=Oryza rufipogon TaxID=4529 RepID=A0A0E0PIZ6_ORYRU